MKTLILSGLYLFKTQGQPCTIRLDHLMNIKSEHLAGVNYVVDKETHLNTFLVYPQMALTFNFKVPTQLKTDCPDIYEMRDESNAKRKL